ncbi:hypothetical protein KSP40_PGU002250 [Platanthera guangdongensis]|uniref:Uncharacterized protein n=1 Tax=Platanthera guangdongensis TaxID=2320717 RepID=A0ABR2LKN7_9ASPA
MTSSSGQTNDKNQIPTSLPLASPRWSSYSPAVKTLLFYLPRTALGEHLENNNVEEIAKADIYTELEFVFGAIVFSANGLTKKKTKLKV